MNIVPILFVFGIGVTSLVTCAAANADDSGNPAMVASVGSDGVQHVSITSGEYYFKPRHIVVRVNTPVELSISKEPGIVPHSLVIDAPQANITVDMELDTEVRTVRFTPTAAGTYFYYCPKRLLFFKSHREKGMEGVLEVTP